MSTPLIVFRTTRKKIESAMIASFDSSPVPKAMITSGENRDFGNRVDRGRDRHQEDTDRPEESHRQTERNTRDGSDREPDDDPDRADTDIVDQAPFAQHFGEGVPE